MNKIKLINSTFLNEVDTKKKLIEFIRDAEILSMGEKCFEYERLYAEFQERKSSIMFNSGSSANLALIQSLLNLGYLNKGDKVGFSAVTWSTNVMPLFQLGLEAIPIDVELNSLNVNSESLELAHSEHDIKVFFITNVLGFCADIKNIKKFCIENNIILIEDNCESLGSRYEDILLGNYSFASTCSSFVGHHISTIEGGMVCTDDSNLVEMLKMVRSHGWSRNLSDNKKNHLKRIHKVDNFYDMYTFYDLAYNLRPTEINGYLGIIQIKSLKESIDKREKNFKRLTKIVDGNNNCIKIENDKLTCVSNMAFPILLKNKKLLTRAIKLFRDSNVEIRPLVSGNITKQPFFKKYSNNRKYVLPNADFIHDSALYLPNNSELSSNEINKISEIISKI